MTNEGNLVEVQHYPGHKIESLTQPFRLPFPLAMKNASLLPIVEPIGLKKSSQNLTLVFSSNDHNQEVNFSDLAGFDVSLEEEIGPVLQFEYYKPAGDEQSGKMIKEDWEGKAREIVITKLVEGIAPTHSKPWMRLGDKSSDLWVVGYAKADWTQFNITDLLARQAQGTLDPGEEKLLREKTKAFPFFRIRNFQTKQPVYGVLFETLLSFFHEPTAERHL